MDWSLGGKKVPQSSCLPRGFCNLKTSHPYPSLLPSEYRSLKARPPWPLPLVWACPWAECQHSLPRPQPPPRAMLQGPAFPADSCVGTVGAGLGTWNKVQTWRGRQIHTRCTRNAQAECLAFESPGEAAQPPCLISLPSSLWSLVLSSRSQEPPLTFQTLDFLPSSFFPRSRPPKLFFQLNSLGTSPLG